MRRLCGRAQKLFLGEEMQPLPTHFLEPTHKHTVTLHQEGKTSWLVGKGRGVDGGGGGNESSKSKVHPKRFALPLLFFPLLHREDRGRDVNSSAPCHFQHLSQHPVSCVVPQSACFFFSFWVFFSYQHKIESLKAPRSRS